MNFSRLRTVIPVSLLLGLPFAWGLLGCANRTSPSATEQATFVTQGHPSGFQKVSYEADGTISAHFEYNDRGRGPKIDVNYRLAADGTLAAVDASGVNYLKAPVAEHFALDEGKASWRSSGENGQREIQAPAFYQSIDGAPEEFTLLVQALLKAPGQRLAMLPAGEAQLTRLSEHTIGGPGDGQSDGKRGSVKVVLYSITGLDMVPDYLWLDDQGRFFASYSDWTSLIRTGWEDSLPTLGKLQKEQDQALAAERTQRLTERVERPLAIEHVRVFDPDTLTTRPNQTVLVRDGRITAVGKDGHVQLPPQAQVRVLDGQGRFLMAGLWDMHSHYSASDGPLDIAAGITTIRDLGNEPDRLEEMIGSIESGTDIGPRVIKAGLIDGHGPFQSPIKVFADTPEEAVQAVDQYAGMGYVQIKIYSSVKPELVPVIVAEARRKGLRVSGHVPAFMNAEQFVNDGVDEIQHINFLFLNFFFDQVQDTRTPARFTTVAEHGAELDLTSPRVTQFVDLLKRHHIVSDPTLSTFEPMFLERPGLMGPTFTNVIDRLPLTYQRQFRAGTQGLAVPPGKDALYRESFARMVQMVGLLYRSGVTIVAGTDGEDALALPREFELYVNAGIPPAEVLRLDTLGAAQVMKRDNVFGRVASGYTADLILVDGDPSLNISDIRKVRTVLRGDRLYDSAALFGSMGVAPAP